MILCLQVPHKLVELHFLYVHHQSLHCHASDAASTCCAECEHGDVLQAGSTCTCWVDVWMMQDCSTICVQWLALQGVGVVRLHAS
jgi:hypothetical protein